jgi:hypothetical protein
MVMSVYLVLKFSNGSKGLKREGEIPGRPCTSKTDANIKKVGEIARKKTFPEHSSSS